MHSMTRRLLLDHFRSRHGRARSNDETHRAAQESRRRLEDLVAAELDPETAPASESSNPDTSLRHRELTDALTGAIAALDPADRLLIALRFEDDRPVRDIASALGLPTVFHVYRRLGSVLAALRRALTERGVDAPDP